MPETAAPPAPQTALPPAAAPATPALGDLPVTALHGTASKNAEKIMQQGFRSRHRTGYTSFGGDESDDASSVVPGGYVGRGVDQVVSLSRQPQRRTQQHAIVVTHARPSLAAADEDYSNHLLWDWNTLHGDPKVDRANPQLLPYDHPLFDPAEKHLDALSERQGWRGLPPERLALAARVARGYGHRLLAGRFLRAYAQQGRTPAEYRHRWEAAKEIVRQHYAGFGDQHLMDQASYAGRPGNPFSHGEKEAMARLVGGAPSFEHFGSMVLPEDRPDLVHSVLTYPRVRGESYDAFWERTRPLRDTLAAHIHGDPDTLADAAARVPGVTVTRNPRFGGAARKALGGTPEAPATPPAAPTSAPEFYSGLHRFLGQRMKTPMQADQLRQFVRNNGLSDDEMRGHGLHLLTGKVTPPQALAHAQAHLPMPSVVRKQEQGTEPTLSWAHEPMDMGLLAHARLGTAPGSMHLVGRIASGPDGIERIGGVGSPFAVLSDRGVSEGAGGDPLLRQGGRLALFTRGPEGNWQHSGNFADSETAQHTAHRTLGYAARRHDGGVTKFGTYALPGGENYREHLLTIPPREDGWTNRQNELEKFTEQMRGRHGETMWHERMTPEERGEFRRLTDARDGAVQDQGDIYKGPHWTEPNVVAHVRMKDRQDAEGRRALHLEEVQSDWHQEGRDKGYSRPLSEALGDRDRVSRERRELADRIAGEHGYWPRDEEMRPEDRERLRQLDRQEYALDEEVRHLKYNSPTPDAPFKDDHWTHLALKHALHEAAKGGYDRLTWNPSRVQNGEVHDPEDVEEGMRLHYDQRIPRFLEKYTKPFGGRVGTTYLPGADPNDDAPLAVHSLDITPALREHLLAHGQPLWGTNLAGAVRKALDIAGARIVLTRGDIRRITKATGVAREGQPLLASLRAQYGAGLHPEEVGHEGSFFLDTTGKFLGPITGSSHSTELQRHRILGGMTAPGAPERDDFGGPSLTHLYQEGGLRVFASPRTGDLPGGIHFSGYLDGMTPAQQRAIEEFARHHDAGDVLDYDHLKPDPEKPGRSAMSFSGSGLRSFRALPGKLAGRAQAAGIAKALPPGTHAGPPLSPDWPTYNGFVGRDGSHSGDIGDHATFAALKGYSGVGAYLGGTGHVRIGYTGHPSYGTRAIAYASFGHSMAPDQHRAVSHFLRQARDAGYETRLERDPSTGAPHAYHEGVGAVPLRYLDQDGDGFKFLKGVSGVRLRIAKAAAPRIDPDRAPNEHLRQVAEDYRQQTGIGRPYLGPVPHDAGRAQQIADAFEAMPHTPGAPGVRAAYDALKRETLAQYNHLLQNGYRFTPWTGEGQPYRDSAEMMRDVRENRHLAYFPTDAGFGEGASPDAFGDHPLYEHAPGVTHAGRPVRYNDLFRAVHDIYGHAKEGHQFGPQGEENAWRTHAAMFSHQAIPALTTETRGQNSWVNFGRHLRTGPGGTVPGRGQAGYIAPAQRPFAPQKAGLLPDWANYPQHPDYYRKGVPGAELEAAITRLRPRYRMMLGRLAK